MKETGPEGTPPPESASLLERRVERLLPVPLPHLKSMASRVARSMMDSMVSSTELMKQAEHCGFSSTPTLNQTGLLNAAYWLTRRKRSSCSNASVSVSPQK